METVNLHKVVQGTRGVSVARRIAALGAASVLTSAMIGWSGDAKAVALSVEGPITAVQDNGDGSGSITVMGTLIRIPAGVPIHSPTATLTIGQLADLTPIPGTGSQGFLGGTGIITGDSTAGVSIADDVYVEVRENVLLGPVSGTAPFSIAGTSIVILQDTRVPAGPPVNQFGFEVDLTTVPLDDESSALGHYGIDGQLYAHTIETTEGTLVKSGVQVSVQRAQCRDRPGNGRDEFEIRGAVALAGLTPGTITFYRANNNGTRISNTAIGNIGVVPDAVFPEFASYRFIRTNLTLPSCPPKIRAEYNRGTPAPTVATGDVVAR